jgi:hypothetical protein
MKVGLIRRQSVCLVSTCHAFISWIPSCGKVFQKNLETENSLPQKKVNCGSFIVARANFKQERNKTRERGILLEKF